MSANITHVMITSVFNTVYERIPRCLKAATVVYGTGASVTHRLGEGKKRKFNLVVETLTSKQ